MSAKKTCQDCGESKASTQHEFGKLSKSKDGLGRYCRPCREARWAAARARQAARTVSVPASKECRRCGIDKPASEFPKSTATKDGLHSWCRACGSSRTAEIRAQAPEKFRAYWREYCQRPNAQATRQAYLERAQIQIREYRSKYWAENKERLSVMRKQWAVDNAEKIRSYASEYRARKMEATVELVSYEKILSEHGLWCYLCESPIGDQALDFDHVRPLSRGGEHSHANIRPTHASCNRSKHDRLLEQLDLPFAPPHLRP